MGEQPAQQPVNRPAPGRPAGRRARRPRFGAWIGTGAVGGVVVALLLAVAATPAGGYSRNQVALYLALVLGSAGALVLGVAAAFLDARADRRDPPRPEAPVADAAPAPEAAARVEQTERIGRAEQAEQRAEERSAGGRPPAP